MDKTKIEWCDLVPIPVNERMATSAQRPNIEPVFPGVAKMVVINLCRFTTPKTGQTLGIGHSSSPNHSPNRIASIITRFIRWCRKLVTFMLFYVPTGQAMCIQSITTRGVISEVCAGLPYSAIRAPFQPLGNLGSVIGKRQPQPSCCNLLNANSRSHDSTPYHSIVSYGG